MKTFYEKYLSLNLRDYGFGIDFEINKVLIILFVGLCVACFFVNHSQSNMALVLRKLIRSGAVGDSNAKTLRELGLSSSKPVKALLSKTSGPMKSIISYVGEVKLTYEEYVANQKAERAAKKAKKKGDVRRASRGEKGEESENPNEDNVTAFPDSLTEENSAKTAHAHASFENFDTERSYRIDNSAIFNEESFSVAEVAEESEAASDTAEEVQEASLLEAATDNSSADSKASGSGASDIDFATAKFYIREDKKQAAERVFSKSSGSFIKTILSCILLLGFCTALIFLMPLILSVVKGIIS